MKQKRKEQENIGQDSEKKHKQRISVRSSAPLLFLRALLIAMILFFGKLSTPQAEGITKLPLRKIVEV